MKQGLGRQRRTWPPIHERQGSGRAEGDLDACFKEEHGQGRAGPGRPSYSRVRAFDLVHKGSHGGACCSVRLGQDSIILRVFCCRVSHHSLLLPNFLSVACCGTETGVNLSVASAVGPACIDGVRHRNACLKTCAQQIVNCQFISGLAHIYTEVYAVSAFDDLLSLSWPC